MRKGYEPAIFLDKKGRMFGFCTGSDACSEHEMGSRPMQEALCRRAGPSDEEVIRALRKKGYPDLSVFSTLPLWTVQRSQNRTLLLRHQRPTRYDETGF